METGTAHYHDIAVSHVAVRKKGDTTGGSGSCRQPGKELLLLGYQLSPVTPRQSSGAVLLFHYHGGSRSMDRRHHYLSGLMRLSRCRKGQAITAAAVFSLEMLRGWSGKMAKQTQAHINKDTQAAGTAGVHVSSPADESQLSFNVCLNSPSSLLFLWQKSGFSLELGCFGLIVRWPPRGQRSKTAGDFAVIWIMCSI